MCTGTAYIEVSRGCLVLAPSRPWLHEEKLLETQVAMEEDTLSEVVGAFSYYVTTALGGLYARWALELLDGSVRWLGRLAPGARRPGGRSALSP